MTWKCLKDKSDLSEVYLKGLKKHGKNVITPTIFLFCEECWTFYRLVPKEMDKVEDYPHSLEKEKTIT